MLDAKSSRYALVIAVAKRAREITDDINLHGNTADEKPVNMAIKEFENGKFDIIENLAEDGKH
jgi:DNA-directed RNA polymerase subunit omega